MDILRNIKEYAKQNRMAINCDGEKLTYKELDKLSDKVASYFIKEYSNDKSPIVICGNKENLILVLMMGALKSGRAYIPLDVTFPVERVKQVIEEVNAKIVINLTDGDLEFDGVHTKESIEDIIIKYNGLDVSEEYWVKDDENAYILFTSGSTGKPKGVQISSDNLDSFNNWFGKYMKLNDDEEVIMNQVSYSFDVSVIPIYIGLIYGKTLNSLSKKTLEDFKSLFNNLKESKIKTWVSTPALAEMCIRDNTFNKDLMPELNTLFFAGEVLSKKLIKELMDRFPGVRIINGYGPTEGTVLLSAIDVTVQMIEDKRGIPIGYPIEGGILKIVDEKGNILKDGEKGELLALGASISKGYFNNEETTKKVFFEEEVEGKVIKGYKTGDLAYYENGILYYCGRKDFQIKLNGFRIELEDIENNLRRVSNVNNCVVFPAYKDEKISHLVSFVTLNKDNELSSLKNSILIKDELKKYIPSYMIPRNMKVIKEFPININGKIDRKKLMEEIK
ncbi:D-alanine--poly(phosphoribitol) ligase subunit DltA [Clostridium gasigenes]|uniref:D-alanine--poly(Phosphoribitol) ligase subunit 1 n=1 Tax=Clostridium gasigenes TaxID=94869 RepID=A0A1H0PRH7_9CLOT|nr:D-alanine--poly(phosphoribitol) ligase subunit DltA [Clostridium gasigenes]SDP07156.1 D-alanine--poly(phosphoribitol) ligase subunit 1 [Clostridium gasigenes]